MFSQDVVPIIHVKLMVVRSKTLITELDTSIRPNVLKSITENLNYTLFGIHPANDIGL